jgi:DNA segregation ATPase FtsK/SpoIIIE, S-DNA-T family
MMLHMSPSQRSIRRGSLREFIVDVVMIIKGVWAVLRFTSKGVWWLTHAPVAGTATLVILASLIGWWWLGGWAAFVPPILLFLVLAQWFFRKPGDFTGWWRSHYRYTFKYRPRWGETMRSAHLVSTDPKYPEKLSKIEAVSGNEHVDFVEIHMLPYQTPELYQKRIEGIRRNLGAIGGRATSSKRDVRNVVLELWKSDPLRKIVEPYPQTPAPESDDADAWEEWFRTAIKIGRLENGDPFVLDIVSNPFHWLIAGISGSGKSGAIWAFLDQLEPAIRRGAAEVTAIDPAMGMELTAGAEAGLFKEFIHAELPEELQGKTTAEIEAMGVDIMALDPKFERDVARFLRKRRLEMQLRGSAMLGKARKLRPRPGHPLRINLTDEIATILRDGLESDIRRGMKSDMEENLRQGRKFGYMEVGAVQNPLKDQVSIRDLFTYFTMFKAASRTVVDLIFGTGAWEMGTKAPEIPRHLPGVCYTGNDFEAPDEAVSNVSKDEEATPTIRMRVAYCTDEHIRSKRREKPAKETAVQASTVGPPTPKKPAQDTQLRLVRKS